MKLKNKSIKKTRINSLNPKLTHKTKINKPIK